MLLCLWNLLQSPESASKSYAFPAVQSGPSRENLYLAGNSCSHLEHRPLCVPTHFHCFPNCRISTSVVEKHLSCCRGTVIVLAPQCWVPVSVSPFLSPWKAASLATRFVVGDYSQGTCWAVTMARGPWFVQASRSFYNLSTQKTQVNAALRCLIKWNIIKKK